MLVESIEHSQAPLLAKAFYGEGDPGPIVTTLANVPELLEATLPFIGTALGASAISFRLKEIIIVRTSAVLGCRYCIDSHTPVALDAGLTFSEVTALRTINDQLRVDAAFERPKEQALIMWIDAVAGGRGPLPPTANDAITAHFSSSDIVDITTTIGATMYLNRYATALQLPVNPSTLTRLAAEGFPTS
jgi:AhpD family alkylhydroperoxidase